MLLYISTNGFSYGRTAVFRINASIATGGIVYDWLYIDDPSQLNRTWIPFSVTRSISGAYISDGGQGTGGYAITGSIFNTGPSGSNWGNLGPGFGTNSMAYSLSDTHLTGFWNREWFAMSYWSDGLIKTFGTSDSLDVHGGLTIAFGGTASPNTANGIAGLNTPNANSGIMLYSLSGHDYTAVSVPEPASILCLLTGLGLLAFFRRGNLNEPDRNS